MYLSMLEETVREIKGEELRPERAVTLSLGLDLTIPPAYVADENWRMMIYKKVARARDDRELEEVRKEIGDRFGEPPEGLGRLIEYSRLRNRVERIGVTTVTRQAGRVHLRLAEDARVDGERLAALVRRTSGATLTPGGVLSFPAPAADELLPVILSWMSELERREAA
jgi:transcription-repair coupling factor (superfamily II helicase)